MFIAEDEVKKNNNNKNKKETNHKTDITATNCFHLCGDKRYYLLPLTRQFRKLNDCAFSREIPPYLIVTQITLKSCVINN